MAKVGILVTGRKTTCTLEDPSRTRKIGNWIEGGDDTYVVYHLIEI